MQSGVNVAWITLSSLLSDTLTDDFCHNYVFAGHRRVRWIDLCRPSSREINKSTAISSTPPTSTSRKRPDPLWYLRHEWWKWPLRPVLLKVEIWAVPHLCRKNCNGNCICTPIHPDQLHMYTQVCALIQDSIIFTACTSHVHPFRQLNFICTPIPPVQTSYVHSACAFWLF